MKAGADSTPERLGTVAKAVALGMVRAPMIKDFDKAAGVRCPHQRHGKGCAVYGRHPFGCQMWTCRWLNGDDTAELRRPDRAGYVIDVIPDFVTLERDDGTVSNIQVVQIWADPRRSKAWARDEALLAYLERRGQEGIAALIRFDESDAMTLFPPSLSSDGQWHAKRGRGSAPHAGEQLIEGLRTCEKTKVDV
jgi:hypothetical protein